MVSCVCSRSLQHVDWPIGPLDNLGESRIVCLLGGFGCFGLDLFGLLKA